MHVSSLSIERFRGVRSSRLDGLRRVSLLLGQNNAGKTSFLEALWVATGVGAPTRIDGIGRTRGLGRGGEADYAGLFYQSNVDEPFIIRMDRLGRASSKLADRDRPLPSDLVVAGHLMRDGGDSGPTLFGEQIGYGTGAASGIEMVASGRLLGAERAAASVSWGGGNPSRRNSLHRDPRVEVSPWLESFRQSVMIPANTVDDGLSPRLSKVIQGKELQRLVDVLHGVDPRIEGIALGDRDQVFVDVGLPSMQPLGLMGTGVRRLLSIVATVLTASGSLVLIDEIDDGLHHSALSLLWDAVLRATEAFDVQIVATTHSREALERLVEVLERPERARYQEDVAAFDLVRDETDAVRAYRYDFEQLDFALEHDLDVRS